MTWSGRALGLVETRGLVGAIEASDAGTKAADVRFLGHEYADAGLVTAMFSGEVAAVRAAVSAGSAAAEKVGVLISTHVIPQPHSDMDIMLGEAAAAATAAGGDSTPGGALESMKVVELRQAARNVENFPIKGRLLARSGREEILGGFRELGLL